MAMQSRFRSPFGIPSACVSYHPGCFQQDFLVAPISHFIPLLTTSYHWARVHYRNLHFLLGKLNILYICIARLALLESQSLSRPDTYLYLFSLYAVLAHCLSIRDGTFYVVVSL